MPNQGDNGTTELESNLISCIYQYNTNLRGEGKQKTQSKHLDAIHTYKQVTIKKWIKLTDGSPILENEQDKRKFPTQMSFGDLLCY